MHKNKHGLLYFVKDAQEFTTLNLRHDGRDPQLVGSYLFLVRKSKYILSLVFIGN